MRKDERGFQLVELVVVLAIFTLFLALAAPPILRLSGELRLRLAAEEVVATMRLARATAVRHCANVALKFRPRADGRSTWALYRDGDGDGVLTKDIDKGVDPQIEPPRQLEQIGSRVRFGFPPGRPARDPGNPSAWLRRGDDPIRFNESDLASFGPLGTATPGSVYLTDNSGALAAVRVTGRTGKVKVIVYDFREEVWK
ncbi:MAG TPA: GspH/FimT family pseudopilin [Thermoanaerobaculia bacterium]|jgi:prepilin-type N-terminal cleavage/methylation domain-containing protein|nr:GspH/FimT family pseudopilin [Thermoanaerobaculia bacterium]